MSRDTTPPASPLPVGGEGPFGSDDPHSAVFVSPWEDAQAGARSRPWYEATTGTADPRVGHEDFEMRILYDRVGPSPPLPVGEGAVRKARAALATVHGAAVKANEASTEAMAYFALCTLDDILDGDYGPLATAAGRSERAGARGLADIRLWITDQRKEWTARAANYNEEYHRGRCDALKTFASAVDLIAGAAAGSGEGAVLAELRAEVRVWAVEHARVAAMQDEGSTARAVQDRAAAMCCTFVDRIDRLADAAGSTPTGDGDE